MAVFDIVPPSSQPYGFSPFSIVPEAPVTSDPNRYQFALPPPPPAAAEPQPSEDANKMVEGKKRYSIMSRLLGDAEADRVASKQALLKFYADNIHSAYNDPYNRTPDEVLVKWGKEMGGLLGHKEAADAINADVAQYVAKRSAQNKLSVLNSVQNRNQQGMGVPAAMPQQAPVPAAPTPRPAQPLLPSGNPAVDQFMQRQQPAKPPGLPAPPVPFGDGEQAGGPAPLMNEPPQMKAMSVRGGTGMNIPPPATNMPSGFPSLAGGRTSRADIGTELGQQELNAKRPLLEAQADFTQRMQTALIQDAMRIGLTDPGMIADFVNKHAVSTPTSVAPGGQLYDRSGKLIASGGPRAISQSPGGSTLLLPTGSSPNGAAPASTVIQGPPALLAPDQRAANAMWEKTHGLPTPPDKYGEAMSEYKEASMTASARQTLQLRAENLAELRKSRQLQQQHLAQTIHEFNVTKGPEAIDSLADQVHENPDLFAKFTGDVGNLVAQRFKAKYGLPAPRPLPADMRNKEDGSIISLNHVAAIKELLKNPAIQKRMGAWDGRVGNLEQAIGTTSGLSDKDARAIQEFRTRVMYLFAQEGKAVFGARPPQALMNDLKASSPSMKMGLPLFQGAMDAVQGMGELNIKSTNDYRFNRGAQLLSPPAGGKVADEATINKYMDQAGNDKVRARANMVKDGWTFPEVK